MSAADAATASGGSKRWNVRLAAGLLIVGLAFLGATLFATAQIGPTDDQGIGEFVTLTLAFEVYFAVGLLLLVRRPENQLGWVLSGIGVLANVGIFATEYTRYAYAPPGRNVPGALMAAWINQWWWYPTIAMVFLFVPLLFPEGRPLTPRWRWLHRLGTTVLIVITTSAAVAPRLVGDHYDIANPIGIALIGDVEEGTFGAVTFGLLVFCMVCALISVVVRFRRSRGVERQQMKWFAAAAAAMILLVLAEEILTTLNLSYVLPNSNVIFGIVVSLMPITIGIAVLRYRLYEIDRIISRTLTYAVLTAVLIGLYLGAVTAFTAITASVAGESPLGVAAATLLAAGAFRPARRGIQSVVDRRFNRARYDAARTVHEFRSRLRDELDLEAITANMESVMARTIQPARSVVWLRTEKAS